MNILSALKDYCIQEHPAYENELKATKTVDDIVAVLESSLYDDEIVTILSNFLDALITGRIVEAKLSD